MSEPMFTPGPLFVDGFHDLTGSVSILTDPENERSAIGLAHDNLSSLPRETALANARLWAAAPDMFAALLAMLERFDDMKPCGHDDCRACKAIAQAKAALAKATGTPHQEGAGERHE